MREAEFRSFMEQAESINSKSKAVRSRISRAHTGEEILGTSLDIIVIDDDRMYDALVKIHDDSRENNGKIQNAVRWYYKFVNKKEFPRLNSYCRSKRI